MTVRRTLAVLALAAAAAVTTSCAASPAAAPTTSETATAGAPTSPVPTPEPTDSVAPAADPTCETIIPESTAKDFANIGWSVKEDSFFIGETRLTGGLQCTWGDYSVPSDHVQVFGWAPITGDEAATARNSLLSSGWREVEGAPGYITENPDTAVAPDEDGYGLTYLFGDGWVKLADTKQGLLLVEWPLA